VLLDHETGALRAILDGRYITEARTGAVSAVSVKHLSRPDATVLAVIGSGVQARSHVDAIRHVRNITQVRAWSPRADHRDAFVTHVRDTVGLSTHAATSAADAARGADIIVLATASRTPVIDDADVAPGAHIAAVGACRPDQREMPSALIARARVWVDSRAAARQEAGDLLIPLGEGAIAEGHFSHELGDVIAGRAPGRADSRDVTIFKSLGLAVEDMVAADLAVARAQSIGLGQAFSWA
jgi:ornithine cyclodeaminase